MSIEDREEDLVRRARDGDVRALESLLERHQGRVLRTLTALGVRREDRDDLAQEVFIRVFRNLPGFRKPGAFTGWVYRITVNVVHGYRADRAGARSRESPLDPNLDVHDDRAPGPQQTVEGDDLARRLESAMDVLSERERSVFVLRELEGLDTARIASALGITRITVRRHLGRARARIRRYLQSS